jgi:hypothetical protein
VDWNNSKGNPDVFIESREHVFTISEKNKKLYIFIDAIIRNQSSGRLSNIIEACVDHYCLAHIQNFITMIT